jgi:small subunit ribosomal protein S16
MVTIRLTRVGSKKRPYFRVVVCEARSARDGASIETLGYYQPRKSPEVLSIDRERLAYWLDKGAKLSDTLRTLVARHKNDPAPVASVPTGVTPGPPAEASAS